MRAQSHKKCVLPTPQAAFFYLGQAKQKFLRVGEVSFNSSSKKPCTHIKKKLPQKNMTQVAIATVVLIRKRRRVLFNSP